jgi:hypothetical protein
MVHTIPSPLGTNLGSGTPREGQYLTLLASSLANFSSHFLLKQNSTRCPSLPQCSQWKGFGFGFGFGFSLGSGFSSLGFSPSFPKNSFPKTLLNLMGFWKLSVCGGNTGGARVVSSRFLRWFGLGTKAFLWCVFGGSGYLGSSPHSHHLLHILFLPQVLPHPSACMSQSLSPTEAHDQTTNP